MEMFKFLTENWTVVNEAPLPFIGLCLVTYAVAWSMAFWFYKRETEDLKIEIEHLKRETEDLKGQLAASENAHQREITILDQEKNSLLQQKQRLFGVAVNGKKYSELSNAELQDIGFSLASKLREFNEQREKDTRHEMEAGLRALCAAPSEEEKQAIYEEHTYRLLEKPNLNAEYESRFQIDALIVRDELKSRFPKWTNREIDQYYGRPTNTLRLREVIVDIESLSSSLPL
jgi:hypothetical protein